MRKGFKILKVENLDSEPQMYQRRSDEEAEALVNE